VDLRLHRSVSHRKGALPFLSALTVALVLGGMFAAGLRPAQASSASPLTVYAGSLASGWSNWSWDCTVNFSNASPNYSGQDSVAFTYTKAWGALSLHNAGVNTAGYLNLEFYLNGGSNSGQAVQAVLYGTTGKQLTSPQNISPYLQGGSVAANTWRKVTIPLATLGASNTTIGGIALQDASGHAQPTIYLADLQLIPGGAATPTLTATQTPHGTATGTPVHTNTPTPRPTASGTPVHTATATATKVASATPTATATATGQSYLVYGDSLASGWSDWSWSTTVNWSNSSPVYSGKSSVAFTYTAAWAGLNLHTSGFNTTGYSTLQFYLDGGSASGQSVQVALYNAAGTQIPGMQPVNSYIQGGAIAAGQWRLVSIPLSALGGTNQVITGILLQDAASGAQPTIYLDNLSLAGGAPTATPTPGTPGPTGTPPPTSTPGNVNWGSSEPFTGIPNAADESYQSKGAEQWLPSVEAAVNDAVNQGLLNQNERQMWENILLGQIDVESTGHDFLVPNPTSANYSQGLTQNASPWLEYAEEDPFDPLTNLRSLLRTEVRYYRKWGNRWDRAVGEYLTGSEDPTCQETCGDGNTTGLTYFERVVNAVWWVHQNSVTGQNYPAQDNSYQANCSGTTCWFQDAPLWSIWSSPNLAYNWVPPSNQNGYIYYTEGVDANIALPIDEADTWMAVPSWFYTASPEPSVAMYQEPAPTSSQAQEYPPGHTVLTGPNQETYPRRTWSISNP
jgi:hypothetical protein